MDEELLKKIKFDKDGLVVVIVQSADDDRVLMQAYMNSEALQKTLQSGQMVFWSRSRQSLWHKGATSGATQWWDRILLDCDGDSLLAIVRADGPACHLGSVSCYQRAIVEKT